MFINRKTEYIISILVFIYNATKSGGSVTANQIFEATEIPKKYLTVILSELQRYGLLRSIKGSWGGYTVVKGLGNISMLDIMRISAFYNSKEVKIITNNFQLFSQNIIIETTKELELALDKIKFSDIYNRFEILIANESLMYHI